MIFGLPVPIVVCLALAVLLVAGFVFRRPLVKTMRNIGIIPRQKAPLNFVRWLQPQQLDALRSAGIELTPHRVHGGEGVLIKRGEMKRALQALNGRIVAQYGSDKQGIDEVVLSTRVSPENARKEVSVYGRLIYGRFRYLKNWLSQRRVQKVVRETFVPLFGKPVAVHLMGGKTVKTPAEDDGAFHIYAWSAPAGSWRQKPPERLFGVPVAERDQAFGLSGNGIPIFESSSDYAVAELVGNNHLYVYFDALASACDTELALLVRISEALREEMQVDKFLAEIVSSLPADGFPIGAANAGKFSIYDQGFDGRRRDVINSLIKEILQPAVRADVFVKQCQNTNQEPLEDGMFHVFFSSAPVCKPMVTTPERLFGYRLLKQEHAFLPSGRGVPICDPSGFPIAELVSNNLYIYADLVHYGNSKGAALFAKLLMEVRRELAPDERRIEREDTDFADQLWRMVSAPVKADAAAARTAEMALIGQIKSTRAAEQDLYRLESTPNEGIGREFDELCKINKVRDISVTDSWISVSTEVLYCRDPRDGVLHEIGAFLIHIPTSSGTTIVWKNQTRTAAGPDGARFNAPHINQQGHACLGNTKDTFPDLIKRREFSSAVELAIAFVESVNPSDPWGKHIVNWPVAVK